MEQKIREVLRNIDEGILTFEGDNLFEAGLLDSFLVIDLVAELEDTFDLEIDAKYVLEENFRTKEAITALMEKLAKEAGQPL
jgi:acyl carrier protein